MFTFQCDDFRSRIHDGGVGGDWPTDRVGCVRHVNDDNLVCLADLLSYADVFVGFHCEAAEADVAGIDPHIGELQCVR